MLSTKFTQLVGCSVPIQQSGMGAIATPELAAAVCEAGGLGMISLGGFPPEKIVKELQNLKTLTSHPFGVNFLIPNVEGLEDLSTIHDPVKAAAQNARLVEFFYRDPNPELVQIVHSQGALAAWQIGSKDEARLALDSECDIIIAQGIEAGGHTRGKIGLMSLLDNVLSMTEVPVVAAGGIGSGRVMAGVLAMGASGVRVGTRFVAARESGAHPRYQELLVKAEAEDTINTSTFNKGWDAPGRTLKSSVEAAKAFQGEVVGERYLKMDDAWHPIERFQPVGVTREIRGNIEAMSLWAGEGVGSVHKVQSAEEIIREMASEAEKLLRQWILDQKESRRILA